MKKIIFAALFALCALSFNSCIILGGGYDDDSSSSSGGSSYSTTKPPIKYLQSKFGGSFSNCRSTSVASRYNSYSVYTDYDYYLVYSSTLGKDVMVRMKPSYYNNSSYTTFESNYVYLKHESALESSLEQYIDPYFNNYKVFIDAKWLFYNGSSSTTSTTLKSELKEVPIFIVIKENSTEYKRETGKIDSLAEKFYNYGYKWTKDLFILDPDNSYSLSYFSSVDDLYNTTKYSKIDAQYRIKSNSTSGYWVKD